MLDCEVTLDVKNRILEALGKLSWGVPQVADCHACHSGSEDEICLEELSDINSLLVSRLDFEKHDLFKRRSRMRASSSYSSHNPTFPRYLPRWIRSHTE